MNTCGCAAAVVLGCDVNHVLQDQPLGSWRLKRLVDNEDEVVYKFSPKFVLKTGHSVTVSACVCVLPLKQRKTPPMVTELS